MKITIESTSSYEADVTISGHDSSSERKLKFGLSHGSWKWTGLTAKEREYTIGGIICSALSSKLIDILQNQYPEKPNLEGDVWDVWEILDEDAASEVARME